MNNLSHSYSKFVCFIKRFSYDVVYFYFWSIVFFLVKSFLYIFFLVYDAYDMIVCGNLLFMFANQQQQTTASICR